MANKLFIIAGIFLIVEAVASIIYSQDQRGISQTGRVVRIAIGAMLIFFGWK